MLNSKSMLSKFGGGLKEIKTTSGVENKMKINDAIKLDGLTEEQIKLVIACASAQGFKRGNQHWELIINVAKGYLFINETFLIYCSEFAVNNFNLLTLQEWCFDGAPDWAVDICKEIDDTYWYTDGKNKCHQVGTMRGKLADTSTTPVILEREVTLTGVEMTPYTPEVGEVCLTSTGKAKVIHVTPIQIVLEGEDNHLFIIDQGEFDSIKPLPKEYENIKHLKWIHARLVEVHGENCNVDYMIKLRQIIDHYQELLNEKIN